MDANHGARRPGKPVLVVENHDDSRELLELFLRGDGYAVRTAANGVEALEAVAREAPCIILLDLAMPLMDGLTFARRLRELPDPAIADTPIILLSAAVKDIGEAQRQIGAVAVLTKPVSYETFAETVGRICMSVREADN